MDIKAVLVQGKKYFAESYISNTGKLCPLYPIQTLPRLRPRQALGHCYATLVALIFTMTLYQEIPDSFNHIS